NDGVKGLLLERQQPVEGTSSLSAPGISVGVASPEYLFAMKAQAARQEADGDDLRFLARELELASTDQALDLIEQFYGPNRLSPKTQLMVEAVMADVVAERAT
ncbi:MAG: hypothetical protein QOJ34_431, partial [Pseudonocardiales bacterium]|nr:hypothetical protein [Pseudonocardiales bacterium]